MEKQMQADQLPQQDDPAPSFLTPPTKKALHNWQKWIFIFLGIVLLFFLAYFAFSLYFQPTTPHSLKEQVPTQALNIIPSPTANWKTYTQPDYNFAFQYPENWTVKEAPKSGPFDDFFTIHITSPLGLQISFSTNIYGAGGKCNDDPAYDLGVEHLTFFDTDVNLFFFGDKKQNTIESAYITDTSIPCPNIAFFEIKPVGGFIQQRDYRDGLEAVVISYKGKSFDANKFKTSQDFLIAKKILATFTAPSMKNWKTYTDNIHGFTFKYPAETFTINASGRFSLGTLNIDVIKENDANKNGLGPDFPPQDITSLKKATADDWISYEPSQKYADIRKFNTIPSGNNTFVRNYPVSAEGCFCDQVAYVTRVNDTFVLISMAKGIRTLPPSGAPTLSPHEISNLSDEEYQKLLQTDRESLIHRQFGNIEEVLSTFKVNEQPIGQNYLTIPARKVRLPISTGLVNVKVSDVKIGTAYSQTDQTVEIVAPELDASWQCPADLNGTKATLGQIVRTVNVERTGPYKPLATKKIGAYTYSYEATPTSNCTKNPKYQELVKEFQKNFLTLEAAEN